MAEPNDLDVTMDSSTLYREEVYTDRKIGTIRALVPVTPAGDIDSARATLFMGEAQMMTQMGPLPISFEIPADALDAAVNGYAEAAKLAIERTVKELQDLRRQQASSLLLPGQGGMPPGALGGGGKIQLP